VASLDQPEMRRAFRRDEAHGQALLARPPCPPDAVDVVVRRSRKIVVHHAREALDVDPPRSDVGRDEHLHLRCLERRQRARPRALAQLPVHRRGRQASRPQLRRDVIGGVSRRDEHQHLGPAGLLHEVPQELRPLARVDLDGALLDLQRIGSRGGRHLDARRDPEQPRGEGLDRWRNRRREQQALSARRQQRNDAGQLVGEAQIEEFVRLVQHQRRDG
jgi:hypothetical protein